MQSLSVRLYLNNTLKVNLSLFSLPLLSFPSSPSFPPSLLELALMSLLFPPFPPLPLPLPSLSPSTPVFSGICSYLCSAACQFALPVRSLSPCIVGPARFGPARPSAAALGGEGSRDRGTEALQCVCM